jgi:hypothetical protein
MRSAGASLAVDKPMASTVTSRTDTARVERTLRFLEARGVITTGVHGDEGEQLHDAEGVSIADVASFAEFGLGQPQRSWLRAWFDENSERIESQLARQIALAMKEGKDFEWAMQRVALWMQGDIQRRIRNRIAPPNAPSTIARKGSSTPLIDTGVFRSAILSYFEGKPIGGPQ